jgi:hypothetical protein
MRVIEKQSEVIRGFVTVTNTSVGFLTAFARTHARAVWHALEVMRRDARATRETLDALAAEKNGFFFFFRENRKNQTKNTSDVIADVFIRALVVAPWRLARLAVRSSLFAWRVVMWTHAVLARVVPARYRVAAGLAAAVAARRALKNAASNASGRWRIREARLGLDSAVLRELRALRRETAERALFEPFRARASARRKHETRLERETAAEEKEVRNRGGFRAEEEETIGATTRATRATTRARKKIRRGG